MNDNPIRALISSTPMHVRQVILVILCCLINSADGYDVLSLALAAPTLAKEWGVTPQHLGIASSGLRQPVPGTHIARRHARPIVAGSRRAGTSTCAARASDRALSG